MAYISLLWGERRLGGFWSWVNDALAIALFGGFFLGVGIGILTDALFLAATRKATRWASSLESIVKLATVVALNLVFAIAFCPRLRIPD